MCAEAILLGRLCGSPKQAEPVLAQLPYVGKMERIVKVNFGTADHVLVKMKWFKIKMNADCTGMLRDSSGMYVVDPRSFMRNDWVSDEPFMLMSPKVEQVFLCEVPNRTTQMLVIGANARGKHVVYVDSDDDFAV